MTKWKDVWLREAPNTLVHEKLAMTNTTNGQNAKEKYEIERRKNNVVARGVWKDDSENALCLVESGKY